MLVLRFLVISLSLRNFSFATKSQRLRRSIQFYSKWPMSRFDQSLFGSYSGTGSWQNGMLTSPMYSPSVVQANPMLPSTENKKYYTTRTTSNGGVTMTRIDYFNPFGQSYTFTIVGLPPVAEREMMNWIESNLYAFQLSPIPYEPQGSSSQEFGVGIEAEQDFKPWDGKMSKCGIIKNKKSENYGKIRIFGGKLAAIENNPWQVALVDISTMSLKCGGTLISQRHVVTAAHCFFLRTWERQDTSVILNTVGVLAGTDDLKADDAVPHTLSRIFIHSNFSMEHVMHDIALLFLRDTLPITDAIIPVCLPTATSNYRSGRTCKISGFGKFTKSQGSSRYLLYAVVSIVAREICQQSYPILTDGMFCAGDYDEGKKDSCQGDSGGPFVCKDGGVQYLYGITSWGEECGLKNYPGVYTQVNLYLDWVERSMELTKQFAINQTLAEKI